MIDIRLTLQGTAPLLMHNSRLANPLDPATKALSKATGKRKKTEDDHAEIARLEFLGSLYFDEEIGPYLPGENLQRALLDAARMNRRGKDVERGLFVTTDINPLVYTGPRTREALWDDENFRHMASVKVTTSRTMRCRPIFREWATEVEAAFDPNVLDMGDIEGMAERSGLYIGLCDWRPRYGRFQVEVEKA